MGEKTGTAASAQREDHIFGTGVPAPAQGAKLIAIGNPPRSGAGSFLMGAHDKLRYPLELDALQKWLLPDGRRVRLVRQDHGTYWATRLLDTGTPLLVDGDGLRSRAEFLGYDRPEVIDTKQLYASPDLGVVMVLGRVAGADKWLISVEDGTGREVTGDQIRLWPYIGMPLKRVDAAKAQPTSDVDIARQKDMLLLAAPPEGDKPLYTITGRGKQPSQRQVAALERPPFVFFRQVYLVTGTGDSVFRAVVPAEVRGYDMPRKKWVLEADGVVALRSEEELQQMMYVGRTEARGPETLLHHFPDGRVIRFEDIESFWLDMAKREWTFTSRTGTVHKLTERELVAGDLPNITLVSCTPQDPFVPAGIKISAAKMAKNAGATAPAGNTLVKRGSDAAPERPAKLAALQRWRLRDGTIVRLVSACGWDAPWWDAIDVTSGCRVMANNCTMSEVVDFLGYERPDRIALGQVYDVPNYGKAEVVGFNPTNNQCEVDNGNLEGFRPKVHASNLHSMPFLGMAPEPYKPAAPKGKVPADIGRQATSQLSHASPQYVSVADLEGPKLTADLVDSAVTKEGMKRMLDGVSAPPGIGDVYRAAVAAMEADLHRRLLGSGYGTTYDRQAPIHREMCSRLAEVDELLRTTPSVLSDFERVAWGSVVGRLKTLCGAEVHPVMDSIAKLPTVMKQTDGARLVAIRRVYEAALAMVEDRLRGLRSLMGAHLHTTREGDSFISPERFEQLMDQDPHARSIMDAKAADGTQTAAFNGMSFPYLERTITRHTERPTEFRLTALLNDAQTLELFAEQKGTLSIRCMGDFSVRCVGATSVEPCHRGLRLTKLRFVEEDEAAVSSEPLFIKAKPARTIFDILVADTPSWAYKRAWTCAMLAAQDDNWAGVSYFPGLALQALERYHERRLAGDTHERARDTVVKTFSEDDPVKAELIKLVTHAYARGMEKPAPRLQQQPFRRVR